MRRENELLAALGRHLPLQKCSEGPQCSQRLIPFLDMDNSLSRVEWQDMTNLNEESLSAQLGEGGEEKSLHLLDTLPGEQCESDGEEGDYAKYKDYEKEKDLKRKWKESDEDLSLDNYSFSHVEDGCVEIWEREVRKGVKAKRAKCIAPVGNLGLPSSHCGKVFRRVPNCKRHVKAHHHGDTAEGKSGESEVQVWVELSLGTMGPLAGLQSDGGFVRFVEEEGCWERWGPGSVRKVSVGIGKGPTALRENLRVSLGIGCPSAGGPLERWIPAVGAWETLRGDPSEGDRLRWWVASHVISSSVPHAPPGGPTWGPEEWRLRRELAAAYRWVALLGWGDIIYNHLTLRLDPSHFLLNPFGLLFSEITASSLVTVTTTGETVGSGCTTFGVNRAGWTLHSALHAPLPGAHGTGGIGCVMHCHPTAGVAVASQREGLLALTQNSAIVGGVGYHDYEGIAVQLDERERLLRDLGNHRCLLLRNHGVVATGRTVGEAFFYLFALLRACDFQLAALSGSGKAGLHFPDEAALRFAERTAATFNPEGVGQKEFAALMRYLDSLDPSYQY